ncbi:MAG: hypothetical protein ABEJ26_06755 [Halosimplex sp.]
MDRLSSCYFCGAALDATLEEHPVVPSEIRPDADDRKTVVLCRTCRRKLDAVLDTVVDAAANARDAAAADADGEPADSDLESTLGDDEILRSIGDDGDRDGGSDDTTAAEASEMEFGDDRAEDETDGEGNSDAQSTDSGDEPKPKERRYTKSRGAGFRREDDGPVESGSLTGGAFSDDGEDGADDPASAGGESTDAGSGDAGSGGSDDAADPPGIADAPDERTDGARSGESGSRSGPESVGRSGVSGSGESASGSSDGTEGADGATGRDRDVTMTRLENTKVMRLLTNREYPVDAEEFVTVAANAYQISRDDCEKVLELAAEHGLIQVKDGHIVGDEMQ